MGKKIINSSPQLNNNLLTKIMIKRKREIMLQMIFIMKDSKNSFVDTNHINIKKYTDRLIDLLQY